jgi:hypothetical protein
MMRIQITAEDIKLGMESVGNGQAFTHCAVARALSRAFPKASVIVGVRLIHVDGKLGRLPEDVADKILDIVNGIETKPFSFTMPELEERV